MPLFERAGKTERELKWPKIWFSHFAAFHQRKGQSIWEFTAEDVIAFSRPKLKRGAPAWKRLKIVQGLMSCRRLVQERPIGDLKPIRQKLQEIVARERVPIEKLPGLLLDTTKNRLQLEMAVLEDESLRQPRPNRSNRAARQQPLAKRLKGTSHGSRCQQWPSSPDLAELSRCGSVVCIGWKQGRMAIS